MNETRNTIILAIILVAGFIALGVIFYLGLYRQPETLDVEITRQLASNLESRGLWSQAAQEYSKLLENGALSSDERAKISFHLAQLQLDRLSNPEKAIPLLMTTKLIVGDSDLGAKADKRIVEALEKSGRSLDAANYLAGAASIEPQEVSTAEAALVVAKVGDKTITLRELDEEIQSLPPQLQGQFKGSDGKIEFLKTLITRKLLLIAAERAAIDKDPDVERAAQLARESVIITKYNQREIESKIRVTDADVRAYYETHKNEFTKTDKKGEKKQLSYNEAKERARAVVTSKRSRELLDSTINRLQQSEGVEIYSENLSGK